MPTYEYECSACHTREEIKQSMLEKPVTCCPNCGLETFVRRIGPGFYPIFKGPGFYETDYKHKT